MRATARIGKFTVNTGPIVGNAEAGDTHLTLVTRDGNFWDARITHNFRQAFDTHITMCEMADTKDAELCAREQAAILEFEAERERLAETLRRLTSHA